MPYDLFISYSRRDYERGQVAALKAQVEFSFRAFAGRDLRVFFDTHEIVGMDDWRQKIQRSLRESQVFLAVLSPHYLASPLLPLGMGRLRPLRSHAPMPWRRRRARLFRHFARRRRSENRPGPRALDRRDSAPPDLRSAALVRR